MARFLDAQYPNLGSLPGVPDAMVEEAWRRRDECKGWARLAVGLVIASVFFSQEKAAGANGFFGSRLIERLVKRKPVAITAIYRRSRPRKNEIPNEILCYRQCDLTDAGSVDDLFNGKIFDAVIHTAAVKPTSTPGYLPIAVRDNVLAQANLVAAAARRGCRRFV